MTYARYGQEENNLFGLAETERRTKAMEESIREVVQAPETLNKPDTIPWSVETVFDDFLDPRSEIFRQAQLAYPVA